MKAGKRDRVDIRKAAVIVSPVPASRRLLASLVSPLQWSPVGGGERSTATGADTGHREAASRLLLPRTRQTDRHRAVGRAAQTDSAAERDEEAAAERGQKQPTGSQAENAVDASSRRGQQQPRRSDEHQTHARSHSPPTPVAGKQSSTASRERAPSLQTLSLALARTLNQLSIQCSACSLRVPLAPSLCARCCAVPPLVCSCPSDCVARVRLTDGCPAQRESSFERVMCGVEGGSKRAQVAFDHFRYHACNQIEHAAPSERSQRLARESRGRRDTHLITNRTLQ